MTRARRVAVLRPDRRLVEPVGLRRRRLGSSCSPASRLYALLVLRRAASCSRQVPAGASAGGCREATDDRRPAPTSRDAATARPRAPRRRRRGPRPTGPRQWPWLVVLVVVVVAIGFVLSKASATPRCSSTTPTRRWRSSDEPRRQALPPPGHRRRRHDRATADGASTSRSPSTASRSPVAPPRRPARAVQARHPGGARGPLATADARSPATASLVKHTEDYEAENDDRLTRGRRGRHAAATATGRRRERRPRHAPGSCSASSARVLGVDHPRPSAWPRGRPRPAAAGRRSYAVLVAARRASWPFVAMERALITRDFSRGVRGRATAAARTPAAVQRRHAVVGPRGLDPAVGADPRRLPRGGRRASSATASTTRWWAGRCSPCSSSAPFFFGLMLGPANPFQHVRPPRRLDGPGPNPLLQNHLLMAFHPPMLYLGYVGLHRAVRLRHRRPGHRPGRRGLAGRDPPLDALRLGLPHRRHRARRLVELRGARLGRLLGLGPGGERLVPAVAHRHRLPPLGDGAGAPRDAAGLEPVAAVRHVRPHHPRHVPHPVRACSTRSTPSRESAIGPAAARLLRPDRGRHRRASSAGGATGCARPAASTRRCRARARSSPTTCCSPPSPSWCCSARCSRSSSRRSTTTASRSACPYFDRMTMPIGLALLFLMAMAPVLPWRKAIGRAAAQPPARGRPGSAPAPLVLAVAARRPGLRPAAGLRPRRLRRRLRRCASSCWPPAARAGGAWSAGPTAA